MDFPREEIPLTVRASRPTKDFVFSGTFDDAVACIVGCLEDQGFRISSRPGEFPIKADRGNFAQALLLRNEVFLQILRYIFPSLSNTTYPTALLINDLGSSPEGHLLRINFRYTLATQKNFFLKDNEKVFHLLEKVAHEQGRLVAVSEFYNYYRDERPVYTDRTWGPQS